MAAYRLTAMVCLAAALLVYAQDPPNRRNTVAAAVNQTSAVNRAELDYSRLPTVPSLFGMNRNEVARTLEPLHLQPTFAGPDDGIAVGQEPPAGQTVKYGSGVAVTLGEMPRLHLNGPAASAYANTELTFTASFEPPLPAGPKVTYSFNWSDGSPTEATGNAVMTHRFADAANRLVSVDAMINDRFQTSSRVAVDVLAELPSAGTAQTASVATTSGPTATVATETRKNTTDSTTSSVTTSTEVPPPPSTSTTTTASTSHLLLLIAAAAVVLLLVVRFMRGRVRPEFNGKPSDAQGQAHSLVAFHGGMLAIEYEIEHPELIRRLPAVALRGGIRAEESGDV
jgi:hypothetical protein